MYNVFPGKPVKQAACRLKNFWKQVVSTKIHFVWHKSEKLGIKIRVKPKAPKYAKK